MNTVEPAHTETQTGDLAAPKRPYATPQLTVHGTAAELTLGKTGQTPDAESAGSFTGGLL